MKFSELHKRLERAGWYIVKDTDHKNKRYHKKEERWKQKK